jgi:ribosomal protein L30E
MGRTKGSKNGVHTYDALARKRQRYAEDPAFRERVAASTKAWRLAHPLAYRTRLDWGKNSEEKRAASRRKWFDNNKPIRVAAKMKSRSNARVLREELKKDGCVLCGYVKCLAALEFHHTGDNKKFIVSKLNTLTSVQNEAAKCIVVCANCHREIHAGQIEGYADVERAAPVREDPPLLQLICGTA